VLEARTGAHHERLVDLGAEVIKVEPAAADDNRPMTWPIGEGGP